MSRVTAASNSISFRRLCRSAIDHHRHSTDAGRCAIGRGGQFGGGGNRRARKVGDYDAYGLGGIVGLRVNVERHDGKAGCTHHIGQANHRCLPGGWAALQFRSAHRRRQQFATHLQRRIRFGLGLFHSKLSHSRPNQFWKRCESWLWSPCGRSKIWTVCEHAAGQCAIYSSEMPSSAPRIVQLAYNP